MSAKNNKPGSKERQGAAGQQAAARQKQTQQEVDGG